ncbi:MAG: hypothetical protein U0M21_08950 [Emergencia sp.]|nr:hypothetical protein [Emergencia sp.]
MDKFKWGFIIILSILFSFCIFPFICSKLMGITSIIGFITPSNESAWIGYFGAALGGLITLLGVFLTLLYNDKARKEEMEKNIEINNEQLRFSFLPYLSTEIKQDDTLYRKNGGVINEIDDEFDDEVCITISLNNIGSNNAKKVDLQIIVEEVYDKGMISLEEGVIKPGASFEVGIPFGIKKEKYFIDSDECNNNPYRKNLKLILTYEDMLGNCYMQEFIGNIQGEIIDSKKTVNAYFHSNSEPKLSKIKYFYITEKDIKRKEKEEEAIERLNKLNALYQSFSRRKELDEIISDFHERHLKNKTDKLGEIVRQRIESGGRGGGGMRKMKILSDSVVITQMEGECIYGKNELSYNYTLKINLDERIVEFSDFEVSKSKNISIINLAKIKLLFRKQIINL